MSVNTYGPRYSGLSAWLARSYRRRPASFPAALLAVGAIMLIVSVLGPVKFPITAALGFLMTVVGLGMLPFGVVTAVRRRTKVLIVRCPHCGMLGANAAKPFRVTYPEGVDYAFVVCSRCGADFTVDRFARLG